MMTMIALILTLGAMIPTFGLIAMYEIATEG